MTTAAAIQTTPTHPSSGGRLVAVDGRALPLLSTRLDAEAQGGLVRARLTQRFANRHPEPLEVTYLFPMPHDAAVSGFAIRVGGRRIAGLVEPRQAARERYEEALLTGRTAALLEQERGSLFTQSVGNVPPGEEVEVEIALDQRLAFAGGAWEWRFPTAVAPRYLGQEGRVADADRVAVEVADAPVAPRLHVSLEVRDALAPGGRPESPSHPVVFFTRGEVLSCALPEEGAPLDRDLVVRWPVAGAEPGLSLAACRRGHPDAHGLLTLVPPARAGLPVARDLAVLVDASGSMGGRPLAQARAVIRALVESLGERDTLELVSFADRPVRWRRGATPMDAAGKRQALAWLEALEAGGATEMKAGILEALRGVREGAQRQVLLCTDGLIGFEQEIVATVLRTLPAGTRLHALGVGESVNRSLTGPVARAGRGLEQVIGLDEDPSRAAAALLARTDRPLVTGVTVEGTALAGDGIARLPDLLATGPALLPLALRPEGGALTVRGTTADGLWERTLRVAPIAPASGNPALAPLWAREQVEAAELRLAAGGERAAIDAEIERLGVTFQIATRLTSWVAVSEEASVDPGAPTRRERMPHELPHGLSAEGLGLRHAAAMAPLPASAMGGAPAMKLAAPAALLRQRSLAAGGKPPRLSASLDREEAGPGEPAPAPDAPLPAPGVPALDDEGEKEAARERSPLAPLRATWRWLRGWLVVELTTLGPIAWELPAEVVVVEGGRRRTCKVVAGRSTASGAIAGGLLLRLTLAWPEAGRLGRPEVEGVELRVGGQAVVVPVSRT